MARVNLTLKTETVERLKALGGSTRRMSVTVDRLVEMAWEEHITQEETTKIMAEQVRLNSHRIDKIYRWIWGERDG